MLVMGSEARVKKKKLFQFQYQSQKSHTELLFQKQLCTVFKNPLLFTQVLKQIYKNRRIFFLCNKVSSDMWHPSASAC